MLIDRIEAQFPGAILDRQDFRGDPTWVLDPQHYLAVVDFLFQEGYQLLVDLTAVDWPERTPRFDVVSHWLNLTNQERLRLKLQVDEGQSVPSLTSRFKTADWYEREVYDLFGLRFEGHPDLERLLMWKDFQGHPLRKDFPLDGGDPFCNQGIGSPYAGDARPAQY